MTNLTPLWGEPLPQVSHPTADEMIATRTAAEESSDQAPAKEVPVNGRY